MNNGVSRLYSYDRVPQLLGSILNDKGIKTRCYQNFSYNILAKDKYLNGRLSVPMEH
jgi:hypothetical protein